MTTVIFLTSGEIDYSFEGVSLYDSIVATSLGIKFPSLKEGQERKIRSKVEKLKLEREKVTILSAQSKQADGTGRIISKLLEVPLEEDIRLNPILFDFREIMDEKEFISLGDKAFDVARPRFLKVFFENQLMETRLSVKARVDSFLKDYLESNKTVLAISHSFLMMILKAYLTGGDKVFVDYDLLYKLCQPEKRPFHFLSGFKVEISQSLKIKSIIMLE